MSRAPRWALALLAVVALAAVAGPLAWPLDPDALVTPLAPNAAPSAAHPLGLDDASRDVLARVLHGARISLAFGALAALVAAVAGTAAGLTAALGGPRTDVAVRTLVDLGLSVPRLLVLIVLTAALGRLPWAALAVAMGATGWFGLARLVRERARAALREDYALAATALGAGRARLAVAHVLPNVRGTVTAAAVLAFGHAVGLEAALSFIGQGVPIPTASWGGLIGDGRAQLLVAPWPVVAPTLALVATVVAAGALADALEHAPPAPGDVPR
jgi:peptide/nickel transport system permease protein